MGQLTRRVWTETVPCWIAQEFHRHRKQLEDLQAAMELKQAREHQQGASLGSKHLHHHQQS